MTGNNPLQVYITLRCFDPPRQVGPDELRLYAETIGLKDVAQDRISALLLAQTMAIAHCYGVEPERIAAEIKHLEGIAGYEQSQTKPATPFKSSGRLSGLSHKHFTASTVSMVAANVLAQRPRKILRRLAEEELKDGLTSEALQRFTERAVIDGYERRAGTNQLTGEWIVFVEHNEKKHYLCIASHTGADDEVLGYLQTIVHQEFPFLAEAFPHLFIR